MSQGQRPARPGRRSKFSVVYLVELAAVGVGLLGTVGYALAGPVANWTALAAAMMTAAAAMGCGGLLGILFGVPRTVDRAQQAGEIPVISANTNLEQISDWLTKILVGVTLTQLGTIKREGGELFDWLAPALGGGDGAAAFAGSVVVYFLVVGFLTGWLYARLRLGVAMSTADSLIELARRADRAGDVQTAQAAKQAALNVTDVWRRTLAPTSPSHQPPPAKPERDDKRQPKPEPEAKPEPEDKPEPEPDDKRQPKPEPKPKPEPEDKGQPEHKPAPDAKAESGPMTEPKREQQAEPQAVPPVEDPGPAPPGGERPE